jgi:hypothetical protein
MPFRWFGLLSLLSFLIVSSLGLLMRAKMVFEMPFLVQKHLQLAHAFFAFNGWVSFTLLWLLADRLVQLGSTKVLLMKRMIGVQWLLSWALFGVYLAFGMGYWSFVTETTLLLWLITLVVVLVREIRRLPATTAMRHWLYPALAFLILSGCGTLLLFWHYMHRSLNMTNYLGSFYSYLHFQYNGWFLFGALALLQQFVPDEAGLRLRGRRLAWLAVPGVLLSLLWIEMPPSFYGFAIAVAVLQLYFWADWLRLAWPALRIELHQMAQPIRMLLPLAGAAVSARMLFQLLSTIPALEKAAFSFRPVVIAYLHLVLLGIFSSFLLYWLFRSEKLQLNHTSKLAAGLFLFAFLGTESVLALMGGASFSYTQIPFANESLLALTALFPVSIGLLCWAAWPRKQLHRAEHS